MYKIEKKGDDSIEYVKTYFVSRCSSIARSLKTKEIYSFRNISNENEYKNEHKRANALASKYSLLAKVSGVRFTSVESRSGLNNFRAIALKCEPCNRAVNFISSSPTAGPAAEFIPR